MLQIKFIPVNKPDTKKAAQLLVPILYKMIEKKRLAELIKESSNKLDESDKFNSGDSVA